MPTSATHITVVERLAASNPNFAALLGSPNLQSSLAAGGKPLDEHNPQAKLMRYASLGAVGPDILYALADYGSDLQAFEDFLVKIGGVFHCMGDLVEGINRLITTEASQLTRGVTDSVKQTFGLLVGVVEEWFLAKLVDDGVNLWPGFMPRRETDCPRQGVPGEPDSSWFWADYLHYVRTGQFARRLIERASGDPLLTAYALGYATHYTVDTVGHPYINTVVGSPWRMYWQRHHLVENFVDAWIWDRWHVPVPRDPAAPQSEPPLDALDDVRGPHTDIGNGAPLTFARLNDHINIGTPAQGDGFADAIEAVCERIKAAETAFGLRDVPTLDTPNDPEFLAWTQYFADTLQDVYGSGSPRPDHPNNLTANGGFPAAADIAAAYMVFRLLMSVTTEEKVSPVGLPPDVIGDAEAAIEQMLDQVAHDLGQIGPPPLPSLGGGFSISHAVKSIEALAQWAWNAAKAVGDAVWNTIDGLDNLEDTVQADVAKFGLWLVNTALFALYRHLRDVLVLHAYSPPFTGELAISLGGQPMTLLWLTMGSPPNYPAEMIADELPRTGSTYAPNVPPGARAEPARIQGGAGPYHGVHGAGFASASVPATPDAFLGDTTDPRPDDMFSTHGPLAAGGEGFVEEHRDFGPAMANCAFLLQTFHANNGALPTGFELPDYNLDGDRAYAWPCWDVAPGHGLDPLPKQPKPGNPPTRNPPANDVTAVEIH